MKHKKDTSPVVPQRDKLRGTLTLRPFNWTPRQKEFLDLALDKNTKVVFVCGPAGSTKTILAVYTALELLNQHRVSDIMYIRSAVESADSKLGYLPGEVDDKMAYYGIPFLDKLEELLPRGEINTITKDERIHVMPVNYIRGQNWNARVAIVDEAQNMTGKEIFTILTRVGKFSKCFVLADPVQSDINGKGGAFQQYAKHFADAEGNTQGVHYFELGKQDIMRDELTRYLVAKHETMPPPPKH